MRTNKKTCCGTMNNAFRMMREGKGISQGQLAELLKIDRSAIAHYESGELSAISKNKIAEAGRYLDINPAYIMSKDPYPFKSQDPRGLIRLFIKGGNLSADISSLTAIVKYGFVKKLVFFTTSPSSFRTRFRKIVSGMATVYAIAMIDITDDIFLFRHRHPNKFIGYLQNLEHSIKTSNNTSVEAVIIDNNPLPDELLHKIQNDSAEKSDLSTYFNYRYTLNCRRIACPNVDGKGGTVPELPLDIIRGDLKRYLEYETDASARAGILREMVKIGLDAEKKSLVLHTKEYARRLREAFEAWDVPFSENDIFS